MDQLGDLGDLPVEHAQRVGIGDHEHGRLVVELGGQVVQVDEARRRALDGHGVEAGHRGAGRIGAVGAVGGQHLGALLAAIAEIGRGHQQGRQFAVRAGGRLQRDGRQPGDLGQHLLQLVQQLQHALAASTRG